MTIPISKWLMKRYAILWEKYGENKIDFTKISRILKEKDDKTISVILSELNRSNWIIVEKSEKDKRKSLYKLKKPEEIIFEIAKR